MQRIFLESLKSWKGNFKMLDVDIFLGHILVENI